MSEKITVEVIGDEERWMIVREIFRINQAFPLPLVADVEGEENDNTWNIVLVDAPTTDEEREERMWPESFTQAWVRTVTLALLTRVQSVTIRD